MASAQKESRLERCRFRVTGKQPELWNAQTGEIKDAAVWKENGDGTTSVPIQFDGEGSVFVVFRKSVSASGHVIKTTMELEQPPEIPLPNLKIIDARYGTFLPEGLADVTQTLADAVKDNRLDAIASRKFLDCDPAPGYVKELRIQYEIAGAPQMMHVGEREAIKIAAAGEGKLEIVKAIFGKFEKGIVGLPADTGASDVTERIESMVAAGVLEIPVDANLVDGDPTEDSKQSLRIEYMADGEQQTRSVRTGSKLNLSRPVSKTAIVSRDGEIYWSTPQAGMMTYSTSTGRTETVRVEKVPAAVELTGPWEVTFPDNLGAPENAKFEELTSWSSSADEGVRHFSGTATYKKTFVAPKELLESNTSLELDLGTVRVMAEVVLNRKKLGVLWKAPFRVDLDGAVKEGKNDLEVRITNLWKNRLIGDAYHREDTKRRGANAKQWPDWLTNKTKRPTERVAFAAYRHWDKTSPLQSSGLLGPVIIRPHLRVKVETNGD